MSKVKGMTNEELILKVLSDRCKEDDALSAKDICKCINIPRAYMSTYVKKLKNKGWKIIKTNEMPPRYYLKDRYQEKEKKDSHVKGAVGKIGKILETLPDETRTAVMELINKRFEHH